MKKILSLLFVMMMSIAVLSGCSNGEVENNLAEQLELDNVESIAFLQAGGMIGASGKAVQEDNAGDIDAVLDIFAKVTSDGEPFEEYKSEGFYKLYYPSIMIRYSPEEYVVIKWEIGKGILIYNDVEYYINKEYGKELYDIFSKYCPYTNGML